MITICKQPLQTVWHDGKTFLCVFDKNNKQIADYDFSSGLKLIQDGNNMTVFIYDKDLVPGRWEFFGTKIVQKNDKLIEEKIKIKGNKNGKPFIRKYDTENPWNNRGGLFNEYVSSSEREKRIKICRSCPLFVNLDGTCSINGDLVIETTKQKYRYCPEEKWGNKKESNEKAASQVPQGDIRMSHLIVPNPNEQEDFENELEEYLKGL